MKVLILDDHSLFSHGLAEIIKGKYNDLLCSCYTSIANMESKKLDYNSFDLIISDIEIPKEDIFSFFKKMKKEFPSVPILVVSMHNKLSVLKKCKELKIQGYILKDDHELILTAVEKILDGKEYYSENVQKTLSILNEKEKLLTPREEKIMYLLTMAKDNHEIAEILFISYNTVKTHRKNINKKLGLSKSGEVVDYYMRNYVV